MTNPRKAETQGSTATFTFREVEFTVPLEFDDYPLGFIEAASDGKPLAIQAREILGPEQWAKVHALNLKGRDLKPLFDALDEALGTDAGEDTPSSA